MNTDFILSETITINILIFSMDPFLFERESMCCSWILLFLLSLNIYECLEYRLPLSLSGSLFSSSLSEPGGSLYTAIQALLPEMGLTAHVLSLESQCMACLPPAIRIHLCALVSLNPSRCRFPSFLFLVWELQPGLISQPGNLTHSILYFK